MSKNRTMATLQTRWLVALIAASMVAAACSSAPEGEAAPSPTTTQTPAAAATETIEPTPPTAASPVVTEIDGEPADTTEAAPVVTETEPPDTTEVEVEAEEPADETAEEAEAEDASEATSDTAAPEVTDEAETEEADEPEVADEAAEPNFKNRSEGSVFPPRAYFDHGAIRALFAECPPSPALPDWMVEHFAEWDAVYAGWDSEMQRLNGYQIASGWWTDEQLTTWFPGVVITAASARQNATYRPDIDFPLLWSEADGAPARNTQLSHYHPHRGAAGENFPTLYERLTTVGYVSTDQDIATVADTLKLIKDTSLAGMNPPGIDMFRLLWNWAQYRTQQPPTTGEPTAWAMRTLLTARDAGCVAQHMAAVCDGTRDAESPILNRSHRLGKALRSIVCAGS